MTGYESIKKIVQHRGAEHVTFVVDALAVDFAKLGGDRDEVVKGFVDVAKRRDGSFFFIGDTLHVYDRGGRA